MEDLPRHPSLSVWQQVLESASTAKEIIWLMGYVGGWPVLREGPRRALLWRQLLGAPHAPWTDELLARLVRQGDGPPSAAAALQALRHPAAGLLVRRNLGLDVSFGPSKWCTKYDAAEAALTEDMDPASMAAWLLGSRFQSSEDLLATHVAEYRQLFDAVCDPRSGGGDARMETLVVLSRSWHGTARDLVDAVVSLVPAAASAPPPLQATSR